MSTTLVTLIPVHNDDLRECVKVLYELSDANEQNRRLTQLLADARTRLERCLLLWRGLRLTEEALLCAYCRAPGQYACDHVIGWLSDVDGRKDMENPEAFTCSPVVCTACSVMDKDRIICLYHAGRPAGTTLLSIGSAASVQGNLRLLAADGGLTKPYIEWSVTAPAVTMAVPVAAVARQAGLFF